VISVVEASRLAASPERVWRFFAEEVQERYPDWHPEHLRWRWLRGRPLEPGAVWFAEEWLDRFHLASRFVVDEAEPGRSFSYRIGFPSSLLRAGGCFRVEPAGDGGSRLVQEVDLGFGAPLLGRLVDLLVQAVLPVRELRRHMREEQANLAELLR
jgi:hypothetical protein